MRGHSEIFNVVRAAALNQNGLTTFSREFPLGEGWLALMLSLNCLVDINSDTGAISEGLWRIVRNIMFKTDLDGLSHNCPGRGINYLAQAKSGTFPKADVLAAADGTYRASFPLFFANPLLNNPMDTVLHSARYRSVELHITLGDINDLFSTHTDGVLTCSLDVDIIRTKGALPKEAFPLAYPYMTALPQVSPAVQTFIDIERAEDLALYLVMLHTANDAVSGKGFSGTSANNVIASASIEDNNGYVHYIRPEHLIRQQFALEHELEAIHTGWYGFDLNLEASIFGSYPTGDKSKLRVSWVNDTLSTSGMTALIDGYRRLKVAK